MAENINLDLIIRIFQQHFQHTGTADKIWLETGSERRYYGTIWKTNQYVILKKHFGNPKLGIFQSFINLMTITDFLSSQIESMNWICPTVGKPLRAAMYPLRCNRNFEM